MTEQKYKPGDVVCLRSGGPDMTVKGYDPKDSLEVTCTWFGPKGLEEKSFHQDLVTTIERLSIDDIYDALGGR